MDIRSFMLQIYIRIGCNTRPFKVDLIMELNEEYHVKKFNQYVGCVRELPYFDKKLFVQFSNLQN